MAAILFATLIAYLLPPSLPPSLSSLLPSFIHALTIYKKDLESLLSLLAKIKYKEDLKHFTESIKATIESFVFF